MKYRSFNLLNLFTQIGIFFIIILLFCSSCNNNTAKKSAFYYSGDKRIELVISGDTLGILLKEKITLPNGYIETSPEKIKRYSDSLLASQGYDSVGYLSPRIKLVRSKKQTSSRYKLEKEAQELKSLKTNSFINNTGYLARIKKSNRPVLLTNEIIVYFNSGVSDTLRKRIFNKYDLLIKEQNKFNSLEYLVFLDHNSPHDVLETAQRMKEESSIKFAQVNIIFIKNFTEDYSSFQWYLKNIRNDAVSIEDADIDCDKAWAITKGNPGTIISIIDDGFDISHKDLKNNLAFNLTELNGTAGQDDDRNGFPDDIVSWNFSTNDNDIALGGLHGTKVMGITSGLENEIGITGVCPQCKVLPVVSSRESSFWSDENAIRYSAARGSRVINCSWELDLGAEAIPMNLSFIIDSVINAGIVFVCSVRNATVNCDDINDLFSIPNVIPVSRCNSKDLCDEGGYGNCVKLLAPSSNLDNDETNKLNIYTTDYSGDRGDNMTDPFNPDSQIDICAQVLRDKDYTACFWGTSASAPQVAGVAALLISLHPSLSSQQVQYLLQDCADKIDPNIANYSSKNGFSNYNNPPNPALVPKTGYGRLNAYEAVKIAAPLDRGGRNGVDIFLRDNELDWGNTEQPSNTLFSSPRETIGHWRSQDIKVNAPNEIGTPPTNSREFENFVDESPIANQTNKVYVRVHNRGYTPAATVNVKLYWVYGGTMLPPLWSTFPQDAPTDATWHFLGNVTLHNLQNSGASVAYKDPEDRSQIAIFDFLAPIPDPGMRNHYCLAALIDSPEDPLNVPQLAGITSLDEATPRFNNITHRNYSIITSTEPTGTSQIMVNNPFAYSAETKITLINPKNIVTHISNVYVDCLFVMQPKQTRIMKISFDNSGINYPAEITVQQEFILPGQSKKRILGGYIFHFIQ